METHEDSTREWIKAIARHMKMPLSQLAVNCGMATSTLTRHVNDRTGKSSIRLSSLEKITAYCGFRPGQFPGSSVPRESQPEVVRFDQDCEPQPDWIRAAMEGVKAGRNGVIPWIMKGAALDAMGILPGDVILIDHNRRPRAGDVVIALIGDHGRRTGETVMRVYQPPYLMQHSFRSEPGRPEQVDEDRVSIGGVVIGILRAS